MRVRVALPIAKPIRRGAFIAGSDGVCTWVKFKYERLSMFCHYCGMLGHDVKHCASHFVVVKNGGEVDYQYGDFLLAMWGRPRFSPNKNTGPSAEWDQTSGDVQHDGTSPVGKMHGETAVEGMKVGNPPYLKSNPPYLKRQRMLIVRLFLPFLPLLFVLSPKLRRLMWILSSLLEISVSPRVRKRCS